MDVLKTLFHEKKTQRVNTNCEISCRYIC